jgi:antirestriction protein ArdC
MDRTNLARALADRLFEELVASLERGDSTALTRYLSALHRFHAYSFTNVMLIVAQHPTATRVAGFHTWRRFNRAVRRGEKGIAILAPLVRRRRGDDPADRQAAPVDGEADTRERAVLGWRTVYVFALDQTDGEPLPSFPGRGTRGEVGPYFTQLCEAVQQDGIALTFHEDLGGAEGTCRPGHQDIRLRQGLAPAPAFCVLAHEYAHDLLHRRDDPGRPADTRGREAEAEAVAAIVAGAVGLDHLGSAHAYIRLYDGNADVFAPRWPASSPPLPRS